MWGGVAKSPHLAPRNVGSWGRIANLVKEIRLIQSKCARLPMRGAKALAWASVAECPLARPPEAPASLQCALADGGDEIGFSTNATAVSERRRVTSGLNLGGAAPDASCPGLPSVASEAETPGSRPRRTAKPRHR